ncbi:MAG TPA: hypothetical protein VIJ85_03175 [Rhizomicrobium sp.]
MAAIRAAAAVRMDMRRLPAAVVATDTVRREGQEVQGIKTVP